jgi:superfamily II DNA or RNA helicase/HKD family nuclease
MLITNEKEKAALKKRLVELIGYSDEMKFLIGFFYFSGLSELYQALKEKENPKLKILVGLNVDQHLGRLIEHEGDHDNKTKSEIANLYIESMKKSFNSKQFDTEEFYEQVHFFIEMIVNDSLIIKKTLKPNHSKLYYFDFEDGQAKDDLFITGSSNLTKAGVNTQDEFNVEISDSGTKEARKYFDDLWDEAVEITQVQAIKEKLLQTIENETQVADVTPLEAYALVLKSYLDTQKHSETPVSIDELLNKHGYERYEYQIDAVKQALSVIEDHNGVIISDVVGLGKSIVASLVARSLKKRGLIISPPGLIGDDNKKSGWKKYMEQFGMYDWDIKSSGMLDDALDLVRSNDEYEVVIIDEAHRFRNDDTETYETLSNICRGKEVILLTATPFNNSPSDIFSLLKLFVISGKSDITLSDNLEQKFSYYNSRFKKLTYITKYHDSSTDSRRQKSQGYYKKIFETDDSVDIKRVRNRINTISQSIRGVIEPVMIRRNRIDLQEDPDYRDEVQHLVRPEDPKELYYELTEEQNSFYDRVLVDYFSEFGEFSGAIYRPFEYERGAGAADIEEGELNREENREFQSQRNLFDFMRRLIVKRFESSFGAFRQSIKNFRIATKAALDYIEKRGKFVLDRDFMEKASQMDEDEYQEYLQEFKESLEKEETSEHNKVYSVDEFIEKEGFIRDIKGDLALYKKILDELEELDLFKEDDPKIDELVKAIKEDIPALAEERDPKRKVIVFSEYTDTIKYIESELIKHFPDRTISAFGSLSKSKTEKILKNFDASHSDPENDYDILLATDKFSEGFNLNRAGVIINFDIPWNPTRVIQRVGRINRIGKRVFNKLYIFNFFPTLRGAEVVSQRQIAEDKMFLIHNTLGEDSKIFNLDEEPSKAELYNRIQKNPDDEESSNLITRVKKAYTEISENYPEVIDRVEKLPPRVKVSKANDEYNLSVFIRKGRGFFVRTLDEDGDKDADKTLDDVWDYIEADESDESLPLDSVFWSNYEDVKDISKSDTAVSGTGGGQSLEVKAKNNLRSMLQLQERERLSLSSDVVKFIKELIEDITDYKTLSSNTHRRIKDINAEDPTDDLMKIRHEIGADFLKQTKERVSDMNDEVIIAIENKQS